MQAALTAAILTLTLAAWCLVPRKPLRPTFLKAAGISFIGTYAFIALVYWDYSGLQQFEAANEWPISLLACGLTIGALTLTCPH